ncbi:hypothetical protein [Nitrospirillum sp. BR 11163]|uniref:hypothetical protein n=1 Tax=Nitrospirillum sp. BR 11163 TaxID=3104323 RepID=UPI002AFF7327|nr:hypothetical protein [Nitrospirillum sp. BR 11163]MEA1676223.1 hypothetical protein [Nitrospirillum sp. BR 11163]
MRHGKASLDLLCSGSAGPPALGSKDGMAALKFDVKAGDRKSKSLYSGGADCAPASQLEKAHQRNHGNKPKKMEVPELALPQGMPL